jgi:uncharacterized protein YwlG (UPF0340 family)
MRADAVCRFVDIDNYREAFRVLISEAGTRVPIQAPNNTPQPNSVFHARIDAVKDIKMTAAGMQSLKVYVPVTAFIA